jgi:2-polyprenyl-3-methyl-5-hydroxy-6-metoxy-1,4-benzoquinol methylase
MDYINTYFSNLTKKNEIYVADTNTTLSYPNEGNQIYFDVEANSFWFKHRNACITSLVQHYTSEKTFFDIGGGNGYVSKGLMNIGMNPILIEPGIQGCANAKKRGVENVVCATLEESGCRENSLPNVGLFDVVEHIEKDDAFIKNIHRYMQEEGLLYITVPSYAFLWSTEDELAGHYRRYSLQQIESLLKNNGFSIMYSSYFFSFLPLPILIKRTLLGKFKPRKATSIHTVQKEHKNPNKLIDVIVKKLLKWEIRKISNGKKMNFGSSCILVAKKISEK